MSALGQKQTSESAPEMSLYPQKQTFGRTRGKPVKSLPLTCLKDVGSR